jgi:hypothetical protein
VLNATHWVEHDAGVVNTVVRMYTSVVVVAVAVAVAVAEAIPMVVCLTLRGFLGFPIVVDQLLRSWLSGVQLR